MKKIAILTSGDFNDRKGLFNAVHNRIKHLLYIANIEIDVKILCIYYPWYIRLLKHSSRCNKIQTYDLDNVHYNIIWQRFSLIDYILEIKFKTKPFFKRLYYKIFAKTLKEYDFIISHSNCGFIALEAKKKFNIPYTVTWHGSDIHTRPFINSYLKKQTQKVIENADCNYFVSKALMECSDLLTINGKKEVLYNGVDTIFTKYEENKRQQLRKKMNVINKKVVTFCGSFLDVKNILIIPEIFKKIYEKDKNVIFWMIGDGKYYSEIKKSTSNLPVILWGNQVLEDIPIFFNSTEPCSVITPVSSQIPSSSSSSSGISMS